jgi:hypothetical protein
MVAISSTGTGIWNAGASWSTGTIPTNADDVTILNTHTITVDTTGLFARTITINNGATLKASRTATSQLTLGDGTFSAGILKVLTGGTFDYGKVSDPIPSTVVAEIINRTSGYNYSWEFAGENLFVCGSPDYQLGTEVREGYTCPRFYFTVATDAAIGSTTLTFTEDCQIPTATSKWLIVNDFTPQLFATEVGTGSRGRRELCLVTNYNSGTKTVTLSAPTTKLHRAGTVVSFPERNVRFVTDPTAGSVGINFQTGSTSTTLDWRNFELRRWYQCIGSGDSFASRQARLVGHSEWDQTGVGSTFFSGNTAAFLKNLGTFGEVRAGLISSLYSFEGVSNVYVEGTQFHSGCCNQGGGCRFYNCGWYTSDVIQTHFNQNVNNFFQNCTFMGSRLLSASSPCGQSKFVQCTFQGMTEVDENVLGNKYEACTWYNMGTITINTTAENVYVNNAITVQTAGTFYGQRNNKSQKVSRVLKLQDCVANGTNMTRSQYVMGDLIRYDPSTSPDPVFDGDGKLPSGSEYVAQITTLSNVSYIPISFRYLVNASSSTETYTFTINMQGRGLASFPTSSQLFIRVTAPGSSTPISSSQVLTANNTWTSFSVTATASTLGQFICEVVCGVHLGAGKIYVDFPTGISSASLVWVDGAPNENLQRFGAGLAFDVASEVVLNSKTLTIPKFLALK